MANRIQILLAGTSLPAAIGVRKNETMVLKTVLKSLIKDRGITITSLSRATKVPLQTLHGWLQGSEPKSLRQVKAVADHLEVDLDYLCFGIEPKANAGNQLTAHRDEINAGIFEVVLRRVKK